MLAVTMIPSPTTTPPKVAQDPGLIQWDIQQTSQATNQLGTSAHLGAGGGQAASAELCVVCKLALTVEVKCQQCKSLYCVNCANVKFNLDDEEFWCQQCTRRHVHGIEDEDVVMNVDYDVNVGASTSSVVTRKSKPPAATKPVVPRLDSSNVDFDTGEEEMFVQENSPSLPITQQFVAQNCATKSCLQLDAPRVVLLFVLVVYGGVLS